MERATTSTVDAPTEVEAEQFAFAFATASTLELPVSGAPVAGREAPRRKRRLLADPVWIMCASVRVGARRASGLRRPVHGHRAREPARLPNARLLAREADPSPSPP